MTVREQFEAHASEFTATERRLSTTILLDYPFAGLEPIQILAERAKTSAPSISRFVTKLGFHSFQDFQRHLIEELKQVQTSPVERKDMSTPVGGAYLSSFLARVETILDESTQTISEAQFALVCDMLSDPRRSLYFIGGRMSDTLMQYLSRHLRQIREKVYHVPADPEIWPEYLLRMRARDILFVADFRRYQPNLLKLARTASEERKAQIILMTDRWLSPVARHASEILAVPINSNTLWDSYSGAFAINEAILTNIADSHWETTKQRIEHWDSMRIDFGEENNDH
ncbi:MurR/RpiR family transcriptional regulator [Cohaesibacter celericrescens]|uniref:RpiR family transcriptional regulator n=1 Tax=Cohaesibacter celericrescens TaxID=2067669 RepID=A0A2N5XW74_9HYPH|nr:MurR/RpiR family transcriptional regulator [Cohaesibacter celericrescens]PLW78762.1 RpiR family transcriptional regulator [Cohaesibacter celericrescens]